MPVALEVRGRYVSLARGNVVHAVDGDKTRCGRPLTRPAKLGRNDAIGWYDEYPEHSAHFCPRCREANPKAAQLQLVMKPPKDSAILEALDAAGLDAEGKVNVLLNVLKQRSMDDTVAQFLRTIFKGGFLS